MTNSELESCKRRCKLRTRWIWPMCFILLITSRSFATEQPVTNHAWSILEAGFHDKKTEDQIQSISALGLMPGDAKAVKTAEDLLQDANADVSRAAVTALGEMNSTTSLPKIKALISHSDPKMIVTIAAVLTKFKDPEGYEIYYELLTGQRKGGGSVIDGIKDKREMEKMGVKTAVGFLPGGGAATGAYDYLKHNGSSRSNLDVTAVSELADDRDPVAEKAIVQASIGGKQVVQIAALRALAKRGDPSVIKDIEPAMDSDKAVVRYTAAATILHLSDLQLKQAVRPSQSLRRTTPHRRP
jgi:HEAT repeat protein